MPPETPDHRRSRTTTFVTSLPHRVTRSRRTLRCSSRPRLLPRAALSLLAVEASSVLTQGGDIAAFTTLASDKGVYLLYVSDASPEDLLARLAEAGLPRGDAISAATGLYQKNCVTPDPLWRKKCVKAWDPKPALWVVSEEFEGRLARLETETEAEIVLRVVDGGAVALRDELEGRMGEMGIQGCVGLRRGSGEGEIVVQPGAAELGEVVDFCAMMLKADVVAFGKKSFVDAVLRLRPDAVGVLAGGVDDSDRLDDSERVFVCAHGGVDGIVEGFEHFRS